MRYSIIIPTYNSERWIKSCINSVLAQTLTSFNVLVLDSGSTDGTLQWIRSLNDSRIIIYDTLHRLSITENWGRIISVPKNEFLTILGHDDILYPHYLETIDGLIQQHPDAGLYQTHFDFINENGSVIGACKPMQPMVSAPELLQQVMQNDIVIVATGFMIRSTVYDKLGGIPHYPNLLYADISLWLSAIADTYLAISNNNCFAFRFHTNNTSKIAEENRLAAFELLITFLCRLKDKDHSYRKVIEENAMAFLKSYVIGQSNKLIYIEKNKRNGLTMDKIMTSAIKCARLLMPDKKFNPQQFASIKLAKLIDGNSVLRHLFLFYKSNFSRRTF